MAENQTINLNIIHALTLWGYKLDKQISSLIL